MPPNMNKHTITQPWFLRKGMYFLVGIVLLGLSAFNVIDQAKMDSIMVALEANILPLLGSALNLWAGAKTNAGSDSKITEADVAAARREALLDSAGDLAETVARNVGDRVGEYLNPTPRDAEASTEAVSGLPVYTGPTSA